MGAVIVMVPPINASINTNVSEVETAEPIGYLYDGTALKWIDTDTINYQHSGTNRFDDLLMTSTCLLYTSDAADE